MKKALLLLLLLCTLPSLAAWSQTRQVQGTVTTRDSATLTLLSTIPDSFPTISVVFKAETNAGEPVWNLTKEKMIVQEDGLDCQVISLKQISKDKPLNIGIVIDHSGSMAQDPQIYDEKYWNKHWQDITDHPEKYPSPLELAKRAVNNFIGSFNAQKDEISVVGFSDKITPVLPLSHDLDLMRKTVKEMQPDGATAFYSAMMRGLDEIKEGKGLPVLIALTDGQDNASWGTSWENVVQRAVSMDVPIYVVGLGDVDDKILKKIARKTNGDYFYTKSAKSLNEIYAKISRRVQAYYELVYVSPNLAGDQEFHDVEVHFETDSLLLETHARRYAVPEEVLQLIEQKKQAELIARQKEYVIYGGLATIALIASGVILLARRRKKNSNSPLISSIFPNPSSGMVTVKHNATAGLFQVYDVKGNLLQSASVTGPEQYLDLTALSNGAYWILIQENGNSSNLMKLMIQK